MWTIGVGLGSNLGDRLNNLRQAVELLKNCGFLVKDRSDVFETPPLGVEEQPYFLNACLLAEYDGKPEEILRCFKKIEARIGRKPRERWGPREIDLDILFIDDLVLSNDELVIPHPQLHKRPFVIIPLLQICPKWRHPLLGVTIEDLYKNIDASSVIRITNL